MDRTIAELRDYYQEETGRSVSPATMGRALARLGLTRKKKTVEAEERHTERVTWLRRGFAEWMKHVDVRRLVFIDEAGSHVAMARDYARAPKGDAPWRASPGIAECRSPSSARFASTECRP